MDKSEAENRLRSNKLSTPQGGRIPLCKPGSSFLSAAAVTAWPV